MKKIILLSAVSIMLFSCGNDEVKNKVIGEIKVNMKDPGSFELVDYKSEELTFKDAKQFLPTTKTLIESLSGEEKAKFQKEYDFVSAGNDDDAIACYKINMKVKGKNSYGGIVESDYEAEVLNNDAKDVIFVMKK